MFKKLITGLLTIAMCSSTLMAHQGNTDKYGGHYNNKTREYHYHLTKEKETHYSNLDFFKDELTEGYQKALKKLGYGSYKGIGILEITYSEDKNDECINKGKTKIRCEQKGETLSPKLIIKNPIEIENAREDKYIIIYEYNRDNGIITLYSNETDTYIGEIMP